MNNPMSHTHTHTGICVKCKTAARAKSMYFLLFFAICLDLNEATMSDKHIGGRSDVH